MDAGSFFGGLVEHWLAELLLIVGGLVLAYLRKKTTWAPIAAYFVGGIVGVAILLYTFTGRAILSPVPTNESNIESRLKDWVARYGYGIQSAPLPQNADFGYVIAGPNGIGVLAYRDAKNRPSYLQLSETVGIGPEHQAILAKLTLPQAAGILSAAESEILRRDMSFATDNGDARLTKNIVITKAVPILGLTESSFASSLDDLGSTIALTRYQFVVAIQKYPEAGSAKSK